MCILLVGGSVETIQLDIMKNSFTFWIDSIFFHNLYKQPRFVFDSKVCLQTIIQKCRILCAMLTEFIKNKEIKSEVKLADWFELLMDKIALGELEKSQI